MLTKLVVESDSDVDQEELDELTTNLRGYLLDELDVNTIDPEITDGTPDSTKATGAITLGTLALTISPIILHSMVRLLQTWLKHRPIRNVKLTIGNDEIEVSNVTTSDQQLMIESFIERHRSE